MASFDAVDLKSWRSTNVNREGSVEPFWDTPEGAIIRYRRRQEEALRIAIPLEPPQKGNSRGRLAAARAALAAAFQNDVLSRRAHELSTWPKPRAAIVLDVALFSASRQGARVDNICKWLLDELAGQLYADDRQVKMLFAVASRPEPPLPRYAETEGVVEFGASGDKMLSAPESRTTFYVRAQTRANVLEDLRVSARLDDRWNPFEDSEMRDFVDYDDHIESISEYASFLHPSNHDDRAELRSISSQLTFTMQARQQRAVDRLFSSLLTKLPVSRTGLWRRVRPMLDSPYIFDLGVLPRPNEGAAFRVRLQRLLQERAAGHPRLFPMRIRSGVTMVLFEGHGDGKDLDNLVRTALPDILRILRPQQTDLPGLIRGEPDPATEDYTIPFLEVVAIPAELTDMEPGSVVFGLSAADRYESWWAQAARHVGASLEDATAW